MAEGEQPDHNAEIPEEQVPIGRTLDVDVSVVTATFLMRH